MKNRLVFAVGGVVAAMLLVGCGGDSELTVEEYFEKLVEISADREAAVDEDEAAFDEVLEDPDSDVDDQLKAVKEQFKGGVDATG